MENIDGARSERERETCFKFSGAVHDALWTRWGCSEFFALKHWSVNIFSLSWKKNFRRITRNTEIVLMREIYRARDFEADRRKHAVIKKSWRFVKKKKKRVLTISDKLYTLTVPLIYLRENSQRENLVLLSFPYLFKKMRCHFTSVEALWVFRECVVACTYLICTSTRTILAGRDLIVKRSVFFDPQ